MVFLLSHWVGLSIVLEKMVSRALFVLCVVIFFSFDLNIIKKVPSDLVYESSLSFLIVKNDDFVTFYQMSITK